MLWQAIMDDRRLADAITVGDASAAAGRAAGKHVAAAGGPNGRRRRSRLGRHAVVAGLAALAVAGAGPGTAVAAEITMTPTPGSVTIAQGGSATISVDVTASGFINCSNGFLVAGGREMRATIDTRYSLFMNTSVTPAMPSQSSSTPSTTLSFPITSLGTSCAVTGTHTVSGVAVSVSSDFPPVSASLRLRSTVGFGNLASPTLADLTADVLPVTITASQDTTAPEIRIDNPSDGEVFTLGAPVAELADFSCADEAGGSGLVSCTATLDGGALADGGTLDTATVGAHAVRVDAEDEAGNASDLTHVYFVQYGVSAGIGAPIDADGSSVFARGRVVPVRFGLLHDEPSGVGTAGWTVERIPVNCATAADGGTESVIDSATPSTAFRYDADADQYIYDADFREAPAGSCWRVRVTLDDGVAVNGDGDHTDAGEIPPTRLTSAPFAIRG